MGEEIYLDYLATTPCDPRVVEIMLPWFSRTFGNAGSLHGPGARAARAVEESRAQVAALLGAEAREIVFTSGATEANNLALKGVARFLKERRLKERDRNGRVERRRIVTQATEHKCVLEAVRDLEREGFEPVVLDVGPDGRVAPDVLARALETPTLLVSLMGANNETGVLQDLETLVPIAKEAGALVHCDLAQAAGKIPLDLKNLGIDLASVSAHKLYGPQGVGALYVKRARLGAGPRVRLQPLFSGGGQERGLRSGTLPVPLLVGFGEAARLMQAEGREESQRLSVLRNRLEARLRDIFPALIINGGPGINGVEYGASGDERGASRLAGVLNVRLCSELSAPEAREILACAPELAASLGSACTAGSGAASYVLRAMGLTEEEARRSLRLSVGRFTSEGEIDRAASLLGAAYRQAASSSASERRS